MRKKLFEEKISVEPHISELRRGIKNVNGKMCWFSTSMIILSVVYLPSVEMRGIFHECLQSVRRYMADCSGGYGADRYVN